MVVRVSTRAAAEAAGAVMEWWGGIAGCQDAAYFGWAGNAVWETSFLAPMPQGMACAAVAQLAEARAATQPR
eukprot:10695703-Alexandrium_andersonii.AAC.1